MKSVQKLFLLLLLWGYVAFPSPSYAYSPRFDSLEAAHGLSMNTVTDIVTDDKGYLWVATQAGLNRYDGQFIKIYQKQAGRYGPSGNHITQLYYSKAGQLWVNTANDGLNLYHDKTDSFEVLIFKEQGIQSNDIADINEDEAGNIWLATYHHGIWVIDITTRQVKQHFTQGQGSQGLLSNKVQTLYRDKFERIWVGTDNGLQLYQADNNTFIRFPEHSSSLFDAITAITGGTQNDVWIGSNQALLHLNLDTSELTNISELVSDNFIGTPITSLTTDKTGKVWVGLRNAGLAQYDPTTKNLTHFTYDPSNIHSLSSNAVNQLLIDNEQHLWIGTQGAGLNKTYLDAQYFNHVHSASFPKYNLLSNDIRSIYRDHQQRLWIGTTAGLFTANENNKGEIEGFAKFSPAATQLDRSFISFIREDKQKALWIGTRGRGLYIFSPDRQSYQHYQHIKDDPHSLPTNNLYRIYFDFTDRAWITTKEGGITRYIDAEQGFKTLQHQNNDPKSLPINETMEVIEDSHHNMWITTYGGGLVKRDPQGNLTTFNTESPNPIPSKYLFSLYQTSPDTLWIASSDGVFSFNTNSGESKLFNQDNGLIGNVAYLMQLDNEQRLWIGTDSGLSILDTQNGHVQNYTQVDGLQDNEFNFGASWIDGQGTLYLGGISGFNIIKQQTLPMSKLPKAPIIDALYIMNKPFKIQDDVRFEQPNDISSATKIELNYQDVFFALNFHSPHLHNAAGLNYQYKMAGLNEQWFTDLGANAAYFTGLSPGHYQFMVKVKDTNGNESPTTRLNITITPAVWQTWWAYLIYAVILLSLTGTIIYARVQKFRQQSNMLKKIADSEQRLQLALWGSGDEFWDWNLVDKSVIRSNTFLAYPDQETHLQTTLNTCVHPEHLDDISKQLADWLKSGTENFELSYRAKTIEGDWVWVLNRGKIVSRRKNGTPARITGTIKNIQSFKTIEDALRRLTAELEDRVNIRTSELQQTNDSLTATLEELKLTQSELIDKEKMAALGGLVASITHEINTPIGISVTAASHLAELVKSFNTSFENEEVGEEEFRHYQLEVADCAKLMQTNLQRAVKLIKSFKQVSVDQSHEELREFNLGLYLDEIFLSLNPMLSRTVHQYSYDCPKNLIINSNPGVFYQIISNLFNNSIIHGYPQGNKGKLSLVVTIDEQGVLLSYQDDGCGMSEDIQQRIFDPFFTTKRGKGGSGLGMNIVYNLVTQVLEGQITLESSVGHGALFQIRLPNSIVISAPK